MAEASGRSAMLGGECRRLRWSTRRASFLMSLESITRGWPAGRASSHRARGRRPTSSMGPPVARIRAAEALPGGVARACRRRGDSHADPPRRRRSRGRVVEAVERRDQDREPRPSKPVLPPVLESADDGLVDQRQPLDFSLGQSCPQTAALQHGADQVVTALFDLVAWIRRVSPAWRLTTHLRRVGARAYHGLIWPRLLGPASPL